MKPLLLIGAALMAGAGIYGFVDYKKANLRKEFKSLYKEEPKKVVQEKALTPPPDVQVPVDVPVYTMKNGVVVEETKPVITNKKDIKKKPKKLRKEHFSRAPMDDDFILPLPEVKLKPE